MPINDLFSKRQKRLRGEVPDIFSYDIIPVPLRIQVLLILESAFEPIRHCRGDVYVGNLYASIVNTLCREYGQYCLAGGVAAQGYAAQLAYFIEVEGDTEKVLDAIELSCQVLLASLDEAALRIYAPNAQQVVHDAIQEINVRFRERGIGYQFERGQVIRVDSELLHAETVKPALVVLGEAIYAGAEEEFLNAYDHYRQGNHKEALNAALQSFESVMKVICDKRGWAHQPTDASKALLDICFKNCLIPHFWQNHMSGLRSLLEGGVPTARNKLGGHGQGTTPVEVPAYIAGYALHMTAAAIVFLAKAEQAL